MGGTSIARSQSETTWPFTHLHSQRAYALLGIRFAARKRSIVATIALDRFITVPPNGHGAQLPAR